MQLDSFPCRAHVIGLWRGYALFVYKMKCCVAWVRAVCLLNEMLWLDATQQTAWAVDRILKWGKVDELDK